MFLKTLQDALNIGPISLQIFCDKSYRIYNEAGEILLDSDAYDLVEDINDLSYQNTDDLVSAIVNETHTGVTNE